MPLNNCFDFHVHAASLDIYTFALLIPGVLIEVIGVLTDDFRNIFTFLIAGSVILKDPTSLHLFARTDVTVYVDGFVNQHFDALALTHVLECSEVALGTVVEELVCTCVEAEGLPEVIFLRVQDRLQRGR